MALSKKFKVEVSEPEACPLSLQGPKAKDLMDILILNNDLAKNPKIKVLSVASLLGEAILRIHQETSVSSLFDSTQE